MTVNLIRSETWLTDDFIVISQILDETIRDFVCDDERIISIESRTDEAGLSRFWIYTTKNNQPKTVDSFIEELPSEWR